MTPLALSDDDPRYRTMFHNASEAMVIADDSRVIIDVNDALCRLFRHRRQDLIGRSTRCLYVHEHEYDGILTKRLAAHANHDVPAFEAEMLRADGETFQAHIVGGSMRDTNDVRVALFCTIRDVSAQLSREGRLTAEREMLSQLYYRTPALLHSIDREGRVLHVSDEWLTHFGYTRDEVIGQYWRSFLTEASRRFSISVVGPSFWRTGCCRRVPFEMVKPDGQIVQIELSAVVSVIEGKEVSLSVCEDVTARNTAMRSTHQQNAALRDFAAFASHDLQSPLRHIQLFSEQLEDAADDPVASAAIAAQIRERASLAQNMVRSLLDFSRAAYGGFETRDVSLEQAVTLATRMVEREITESEASIETGALPVVRGDLNLIARVFQNLIGNAIKHGQAARPVISVSAEVEAGLATVCVRDNGVGLPLAHSRRAFAAYESLPSGDDAKTGCGLGLSICRQIVNSHGGEIWVDDDGRPGTTLRFTLPTPDQNYPISG